MKFLAIDDNSVDLMIARAAVQRFNPDFEVITSASADEALHYLKGNSEAVPDVILLDLNMPVKTGWDFLKEYKNLSLKPSRIYILTSSINETEKNMADKEPLVTDFLTKPLRLETIQKICSPDRSGS